MTEALRVAGFSLAAALAAFTLRSAHREAGAAVAISGGLMLFFFAVTRVSFMVEALRSLSQQSGGGEGTLTLLLKLMGMAYVTEFAVQACQDAGENGLAAKAALCGKLLIAGETLPLILEIGQLTLALAP